MTSVYLKKSTKQKLYKFINRSRVSPVAFSEKRLKNPNQAIEMLVNFALRFAYDDFEKLTNIPLVSGELPVEVFDNEEERNQIILKQFEEVENEGKEDD